MREIHTGGNDSSPRIDFDPKGGRLWMQGRSLMEDPKAYFSELRAALDAYVQEGRPSGFVAEFYFEYLNTTSTKEVFRILQTLGKLAGARIVWKWEEGDEDMLSTGKRFARLSGLDLQFESVPG